MASIKFKNIYLGDSSTISSHNEKIHSKFSIEDYFDGETTSEQAEIKMQKTVIKDLSKEKSVDLIVGGDLSNQIGITNKAMSEIDIPYFGVYSACATYVESIITASSILAHSNLKNAITIVSSHNLDAERTFRYPIEYGSPRRITQNFTATGAVASLISKTPSNVKLEYATIGKVIDYGIKDANNMGAIMAPSAVDTLLRHLKDTKRDVSYYDLILTGDLGKLGSELFKELLSRHDITIKNHIDAGSKLIVDKELTDQGASGPICLPLYLVEEILTNKKYKHILLIATGSLQNSTLVNQKQTLPGVSHALSLEVE